MLGCPQELVTLSAASDPTNPLPGFLATRSPEERDHDSLRYLTCEPHFAQNFACAGRLAPHDLHMIVAGAGGGLGAVGAVPTSLGLPRRMTSSTELTPERGTSMSSPAFVPTVNSISLSLMLIEKSLTLPMIAPFESTTCIPMSFWLGMRLRWLSLNRVRPQ